MSVKASNIIFTFLNFSAFLINFYNLFRVPLSENNRLNTADKLITQSLITGHRSHLERGLDLAERTHVGASSQRAQGITYRETGIGLKGVEDIESRKVTGELLVLLPDPARGV